MQDTDIEGLEPKAAADYVLAFVTTLKRTELELARVLEEVATWTRRVAFATEKGQTELAGQARTKLAEIEQRRSGLEAELADLRVKVGILREKLQRLRQRFQKSVDTDVLLAELEMLAGKKDTLAESFTAAEADAKVEELKRKMAGDAPAGSDSRG